MQYDITIIGAGIVGLATAYKILGKDPGLKLLVLEKEQGVAMHQTGNNSGVIHAGLYYRPDSLKARLCTTGRNALYKFCEQRKIPHQRCGKIVVATRPVELAVLNELERRGKANGLARLRRLTPEEIREREPWDTTNWTESYAQFQAELADESTPTVPYFPVWMGQRGRDPKPLLTFKPDPEPVRYHWQNWNEPIFQPDPNDDGLRWDLLEWTDNP